MTRQIEVSIHAYAEDANGDLVDWRSDPNFGQWSEKAVEVRELKSGGLIEVLEEYEELKEDEANRIYEQMCAKYPDADHCIEY